MAKTKKAKYGQFNTGLNECEFTLNEICTVYDNNYKLLSILIKYDDNFKNMYDILRLEKQEKIANNKQTMDSVTINFGLIKKYDLNWKILYQNENVELNLKDGQSC